ncbi:hypothetical protein FB45DRAFT_932883 [Roridomyces roridus]|uniref:MYND-type domain-containing protein n=1 Tax=Roridomyces roridus TaxID=1738132 RepID=A0AAD7BDX3_9AGAR|nr:hypothetical protein FB45DRAFT_932883 [Roridomyces roridus]
MAAVNAHVDAIEMNGFCVTCRVTLPYDDLKRCSRCQNATYCSTSCQKSHWKVHKKFCKTPEEARLETEDEAWAQVGAKYGHKKSNQAVLGRVPESLEAQGERFNAWVDEWEATILAWAFWAMNIPSPSTRDDILLNFTFVFELQRRLNPATPDHYFEMHGAEIMHTSEMIYYFQHCNNLPALDRWRQLPRFRTSIQIMVGWKGHLRFLYREVPNFTELQNKGRKDLVQTRFHDALAKNWVDDLRKAVDSTDREFFLSCLRSGVRIRLMYVMTPFSRVLQDVL